MLAALPGLLCGQETLHQIEARAAELKSKGDAAGSLAAWEKAATLAPQSAHIQDEIGFLLATQNRLDEALQHFQYALAIDAGFAPAQYHLGVAYWLRGDAAESIPHLQSAVGLAPENFEYRFYFGHA